MSILSKIIVDVKHFFSDLSTSSGKFSAAFVKLFKKAPAAIQVVQNFTAEVAPIIVAATLLVDPLAEPEVAGALAVIETGLAAVEASAVAANSGQGLVASLAAFADTVPQLLTGVAIKNPALQAQIEKIVVLVVSESKVLIPAVQAWVAQIKTSTTAQ